MKRGGYTVKEFFIVAVLISVLVALLLPALRRAEESAVKEYEAKLINNLINEFRIVFGNVDIAHPNLMSPIELKLVQPRVDKVLNDLAKSCYEHSDPERTNSQDETSIDYINYRLDYIRSHNQKRFLHRVEELEYAINLAKKFGFSVEDKQVYLNKYHPESRQ